MLPLLASSHMGKNQKYASRNEEYKRRHKEAKWIDNLTPEAREKKRAQWRESAKKKREQLGRDEINRKNRESYARNKEARLKAIYEGRRRRDPTIGLYTAIHSYRRGERDLDGLVGSFRAALIQSDALTVRGPGEEVPRRRGRKRGQRNEA